MTKYTYKFHGLKFVDGPSIRKPYVRISNLR